MWTGTMLILAVVLVLTVEAYMESSGLICDVNNLDPVNVPEVLKGTLFRALSTGKDSDSSGVVVRYKLKDPNTLIVKSSRYNMNYVDPSPSKCFPGIEFTANITEHGFERKDYKILIIAHSDNHVALMFEPKKKPQNGIFFIYARNFRQYLKMTDIDSAMLEKIKERCGEEATRLDFYDSKYIPIPAPGDHC